MPAATDFRKKQFAVKSVKQSGNYLGRAAYARLYTIENLLRVVINSILHAQVGANWWSTAVAQPIKDDVERYKRQYSGRPWHTAPGAHDIYFTQLRHLSEIIRANRNHFDPLVRDVDQWIAEIERIRLPRNIVGHMNFPSSTDQQRLQVFYNNCVALVEGLRASPIVALRIP